MLNEVILIGLVGKNGVDLKYTPNGKAVAKFMLGVKRNFKNPQGEYDWDNIWVIVWGKQAENAANYLNPKDKCGIVGRWQVKTYDDNGKTNWINEVIAEKVLFLTPKQNDCSMGENIDFTDDEIPF